MFIPKSILCAISITATVVNGYKLAFYNSASGQCTGEFLGSWSGGPDTGCRTDYAGIAQDVVVTSDRDGDHDNTVTFFSSDDCDDANVINMSQGGCMTVDSSISAYSSFQVIDGTTRKKRDSNKNHGSLSIHARNQKSRREADVLPIHHGDTFEHNNATYRWHQLAQGVWSGVLIDEWDDNINVMSNDFLEIPESIHAESDDDELLPVLSLNERSLQGQCKVAVMCTVSLAHAGAAGIRQLGAALVDKAAAQAPKVGKGLWEFTNRPFVATVGGTGITGFAVMYVNNRWAPGKADPSQCSTKGSEADVLKGSIKEATYFTDLEAVELVLTLENGKTSTVSIAVTKTGNKSECGVPATGDKA